MSWADDPLVRDTASSLAGYIAVNVGSALQRRPDDLLWVTDLGSARLQAKQLIELIEELLK